MSADSDDRVTLALQALVQAQVALGEARAAVQVAVLALVSARAEQARAKDQVGS